MLKCRQSVSVGEDDLMQSIHEIAKDYSVSILLRHAEREPILQGTLGNEVALTSSGINTCLHWRQQYGHLVRSISTSPIKRCVDTSKLLSTDDLINIHNSPLLGDPGIFVQAQSLAAQHFMNNSVLAIVKQLLEPCENPTGFCFSTSLAIKELIEFMLQNNNQSGLHLYITHDSILAVLLGYYFSSFDLEQLWPNYLEGLYLIKQGSTIRLHFRHHMKVIS